MNNYQRAQVGIGGAEFDAVGGFAALFYQGPDATWKFFKGTQNILPCSDYATEEVKKAYLGQQCLDTATDNENATVSL